MLFRSTRAAAAKAAPGLLVLAVNRNMSGQTPGSRFGLLHDVLGVKPALPADPAQARGIALKMDDIARIDPEWLFVIDRNAGTGSTRDKDGKPVVPSRELFDNDTIKNTRAGRKQQLVFVDPQLWYLLGSSGPQAMRANGTTCPLAHWRDSGQPVIAVAGIAQPERFFSMLEQQGLSMAQRHALPDHVGQDALASLARQWMSTSLPVLCTEKDAVKLWDVDPSAWAVPLVLEPEKAFFAALNAWWLSHAAHPGRAAAPSVP